ncbi:MAG: response regulator [Lachnospiraceae bacterium]|nr:response regulator [Lachnospiraceae bacterium]
MVSYFYLLVFIAALMMLGRVLFDNKKVDTLLIASILLIVINSAGIYILSVSGDLEVAIVANKILYVGATYTPFTFVLLLASVCKLRMPKPLVAFLFAYSTLVMTSVMTIGHTELYYKSVKLGVGDGYYYLIKEYGPMHAAYVLMMALYVCIMAFFVIYGIKNRKNISTYTVVTMSAMGFLVFALYLIEKIFSLNIDFLLIGYLLATALFIKYFERINMYDMSTNIINAMEKKDQFGYIAFDGKYRYIAANNNVKNMFPEINEWVVDQSVEPSNDYVYTEIVKYMLEWDGKENNKKFVTSGDKYYELEVKYITNGHGKNVGYLLEFNDRTMEKKYYNTIEEFSSCLEEEVEEKTREIHTQQEKLENLFLQTVTALSEAVDAKDRYTSGHSNRVAEYAKMIASKLGKSKEEQEQIYRAGLLHDIGKIRIPAEIINKPGKLTDEEYNIIKIHPVTGYHILKGISDDNEIAVAAKYHHERYDGNGYPNGLEGEMIPEIARILGVADAYDAMASNRSYRNALPQDVVRKEIEKGKGTQFDPVIADIMLELMAEDKEYQMKESDGNKKYVLTIDDTVMNNKLIARIMEDEPLYEIISVTSGYDALDILEKQKFDLILLDVKMPGMNGMETLKLIREKYDTPVVLMTSDKTLEAATEFAEYGCDDFITKPFLPLLLKETIYNMSKDAY